MSTANAAPQSPLLVDYVKRPISTEWGENSRLCDMHNHNTSIAIPKLEGVFKRLKNAIGNRDEMLAVARDFENPRSEHYIADDEIKQAALALIEVDQKRGTDRGNGTVLRYMMPRASWQRQDVNDALFAVLWAEIVNVVIYRLVQLYPDNFVGGIQLPQYPGDPRQSVAQSVEAINRWAQAPEMIGCLVNPNPGAAEWKGPPMDHKIWNPLYETMQDTGMTGLIHVSEDCSAFHDHEDDSGIPLKTRTPSTWAAYMDATNTAFYHYARSNVADDFPNLRIHFPHGLAAALFQMGKVRGILKNAMKDKFREPTETILKISRIDTIMYAQDDYNGLMRCGDQHGLVHLFMHASEHKGAAPGTDTDGHHFDDVGLYHRHAQWGDDKTGKLRSFTEAGKESIRHGAAETGYPRLPIFLAARAAAKVPTNAQG